MLAELIVLRFCPVPIIPSHSYTNHCAYRFCLTFSDIDQSCIWGLRHRDSSTLFLSNVDLDALWEDGMEKTNRNPKQTERFIVSSSSCKKARADASFSCSQFPHVCVEVVSSKIS